jgi:hypothetical protein
MIADTAKQEKNGIFLEPTTENSIPGDGDGRAANKDV